MATLSGFDSVPQALTQRALAHNFNLEEKARREEAVLNKDFYYGKQEQTLNLMNDDVEPMVMNITKPIMSKRASMLYSRPLIREFMGPAASISFLEKVYHENSIDTVFKKADLLSELTGSALLHPASDDSFETGLRLVVYDATQFSAVGQDEDPTTADSISLIRIVDRIVAGAADFSRGGNDPQIERVLQQQIWTPNSVTVYDGDAIVSSEPNELGFLPFVNIMGEEVPDQYIGYPPATLVRKANHHINTLLTHLGFMIKMQSGTPIVFSGFKSGESVIVHPGRAINIPADTAASVLNLSPKINETLTTIEFLEDRLYTCSSVPRISVEGGEGTSGRELMVRWFPLLQVFHEKTVRFRRYELEVANMILSIAGYEPIEDIHINWPEESVLPLSAEEEELERDVTLGIRSPIDEIMRRNPEMDEAEATIEWMTNMQLNVKARDLMTPPELEESEEDDGRKPAPPTA